MSRLRHRITRLLGGTVMLTGLLLAADAWARAGGGQHYSGGSSNYSSHSYSGHGSGGGLIDLGQLVYWIIRLTFAYPGVMVPLWLILIGAIVFSSRQRRPGEPPPRSVRQPDTSRFSRHSDAQEGLAELRARDPDFDPAAFFERVRGMFLEVQEAWFLRDLTPVRMYMSDAVFRRFTTLLAMMQLEKQRNAIDNVQVATARLVEVTRTAAYDCLSVRIEASMKDIDVADSLTDDQARAKAARARDESFVEIWTFVRRRGAQSKADVNTSQGKCPNCGAPFTGGAANKCTYCNAIVNSGNFDWVLTEITQESEHQPRRLHSPGLDALVAKDPDAAVEILQDRALLLFWKWLEALAFGDPKRMRKLATSSGFGDVTADVARLPAQPGKALVKLAAVGGTAVLAVETDVEDFDRVHVEIRWSAAFGRSSSPTPFRSVVTMVRSASARTDRGAGLSNERCGQCGAPLTNSDSTTCDFCGHDLAGATREWQFQSLVAYERWDGPG